MNELQIAPPEDGTPVRAVMIAVLLLGALAAAVFYLNPRKTADLSVKNVQILAPHTVFQSSRGAVHVLHQPPASEDDLYVAATVQLDNKLRLPIFFSGASAGLTTADGGTSSATVIAPQQWSRLEASFPQLTPLLKHPLADGAEVLPEGSTAGTVLLLFPGLSANAWTQKKSATLQIRLAHQSALHVKLT